jgi:hypothetical protein
MVLEGPDGESAQAGQIAARTAQINAESAQIQASAQRLSAAAGTGFQIEPEAAATLIQSCMKSLDELGSLQQHLASVGQAPKLGTTPGAKVVAPFTQQVATDQLGIVPAIQNLTTTLKNMIQAYQKASTNYAETEAIVQASLPKPPVA